MSILWEHRQTRGVRGRPSAAGRPAPGLYRHGPPAGTVRVLRRLPAIGARWSTLMTLRRVWQSLVTVGMVVAVLGFAGAPRGHGVLRVGVAFYPLQVFAQRVVGGRVRVGSLW